MSLTTEGVCSNNSFLRGRSIQEVGLIARVRYVISTFDIGFLTLENYFHWPFWKVSVSIVMANFGITEIAFKNQLFHFRWFLYLNRLFRRPLCESAGGPLLPTGQHFSRVMKDTTTFQETEVYLLFLANSFLSLFSIPVIKWGKMGKSTKKRQKKSWRGKMY